MAPLTPEPVPGVRPRVAPAVVPAARRRRGPVLPATPPTLRRAAGALAPARRRVLAPPALAPRRRSGHFAPRGGVPVPEIAALRTGRHPIDGAQAAGDLLLPDPHRHQRLLRSQRDAQLQAVPGGFAHHRQAGAIRQRQGGVVQVAASRQGEAQVAPHLTGAPRMSRQRPPRRCRPGRRGSRGRRGPDPAH